MVRPRICERRVRHAGILGEAQADEDGAASGGRDPGALADESGLAEAGFTDNEENAATATDERANHRERRITTVHRLETVAHDEVLARRARGFGAPRSRRNFAAFDRGA